MASKERFQEVVERVNALMRDLLGFDYEPTTEVNNIVATADLDSLPSLETVAIGLGFEQTEYEPEQFPALIYRSGDSLLLVFPVGKLSVQSLLILSRLCWLLIIFLSR